MSYFAEYLFIIVIILVRHERAALNYTFIQSQAGVKRMRRSWRPHLPQTIHELAGMLVDPQNENYVSTFQVPPSTFFNQELIVNGLCVGIVFANTDAIERYRQELATVQLVGIDGTYKTVPKVPGDSFLTFQVLYKNVVSNY